MIYDELSARYSDLVNRLKATGDYDLEITDKDWRAQELSSENYDGGDPDGGIFEKPLVMKTLKTHEKLKVPDRRSLTDDRMKYFGTEDIPEMREKLKAMFDEQRGRLDDYYAELLRDAGDAREKVKLIEEKGKYRKELERLETCYRNFLGFPLTIQEGETSYHGTISNIRFGKTGNPGAASNLRVSFLVESPVRISAQASQIGTGKNIQIFHAPHGVTLDTIFTDRGTREFETERRVFVGNILKGVAAAEGNGKIVRYTTSDGRTEMGVAMPSVFRMSDLKNDPRRKLNTEDEILRYLNRYHSVTGDFGLEIVENYGDYRIFVDKNKNSGGQIYLDSAIRDIVGDFRQNRYRAKMELEQHTLDGKTFRRVLPLLMEKTQISGELENMRKFRGSEPAKLSVPGKSGFQENAMASSDTPVETVSISTPKHYLTSQADTILRARIRKEQEKTGSNYLKVSNRMTGMTARITTGSASKMRSGKAVSKSTVKPYVHAAAMLNLEKLFDRAMLGISHDDRKHSESVIRMHRFFVGMDYEGKRYGVKMTVKEMREGFNHLYSIEAHDIQIEEMKNPGSEEPSGDMARSQLPKEAGEPWAISGDKTPAVWKNLVFKDFFEKFHIPDHTVSDSGENVKSETENIPPESAPGRPAKLSVPGMERDGNRIRGFFSALFEKDVNAKTDVNPVAKHLGTIFHYSRKVPSLFRTYLAASEIVTDKTKIRDWILNGNTGRDIFAEMSAFKKRDPEHYRKMNEYLLERDKNRDGLDVALRKDEKGMEFFAVVRKGVGTVSGRYESEDEAWEIAWSMERRDLADAGFGEEAAEFVYQWRHIFNRQWLEFKGKWDEVKKSYEDAGEEVPFIDGIDLDAELNKMGRLRGSYFPRIRHGNLLINAEKEGENPRTEAFTNQVARAARAAHLRARGYHVTLKRSERPSEEAFSASSVAALNDFVNNAFNRMNAKSSTTFRDFGLMPEYEEYTRKDGTKETHLILRGNKRRFDRILKNFGGKYYKDGWRFRNVDPAFEKSLLQAVAVHVGVVSGDVNLFGKVLAEQLALLIHSHGSRSAMIGRSDATGEDVHLGYEEDALTALALSVSSAAGGSAKGIAARKMLRAFTGTDVSFESWLKQEYPDESKRPEDYSRLYEEYRAFVDDRRIDSALQPRAFKSGTDFMTDVMRNDTDTEHVIGVLRGVMATYYLSRPSSGIINLSTMFTNVPAMMSAYGGVSIRRAGVLLSQESKRYLRYLLWNKYGKGKNLSEEDAWVYRKIHEYGWDESQMSDEMAGEIMTWGSRAWRKITGTGLLVFASTEQFNRNVTIAAAFRGLMEREKGTVTEARREELLRKAKNDISDRAHGVYGKINLPDAMRGASAGAQVFRSFYSYKTYTHNYLQSLLALGLKRPKETAWMVLSPAVLAGAPATVLTPLAALVFSSLGLEPPDGVEAEFYRWMRRTFGTSGERFGRMGVAGLAGVNLTGSMSMMGVTELPTSLEEVLGAPYSMSENIVKGIGNAAHGNFGKAAERILPAMLSAPVKAAREAVRGVTKSNNQPVIYEGEALQPDMFDTVMRSLGFNPASISEKREKLWEQQRASSFYRKQRSEIYNEMRDWYVSGRKSGEWARILRDVEEYNARVRRSGRENIPLITEEVIKRTIRNASKGR